MGSRTMQSHAFSPTPNFLQSTWPDYVPRSIWLCSKLGKFITIKWKVDWFTLLFSRPRIHPHFSVTSEWTLSLHIRPGAPLITQPTSPSELGQTLPSSGKWRFHFVLLSQVIPALVKGKRHTARIRTCPTPKIVFTHWSQDASCYNLLHLNSLCTCPSIPPTSDHDTSPQPVSRVFHQFAWKNYNKVVKDPYHMWQRIDPVEREGEISKGSSASLQELSPSGRWTQYPMDRVICNLRRTLSGRWLNWVQRNG